jgi:hypothetical protein
VPVPQAVADLKGIMIFEIVGVTDAPYVIRLIAEKVAENIYPLCAVYLLAC